MGDPSAREQLIGHYLPYARMLAATVFARRIHDEIGFDDYLQLASLGLLEALDRFDPCGDAQFETFCAKRIRGAVLSGLAPMTEQRQQIAARTRLRKERLASLTSTTSLSSLTSLDVQTEGDAAESPAARQPRSAEALFAMLAEVGIGLALGVLLEGTGMLDADAFGSDARAASPEVAYFRRDRMRELSRTIGHLVGQLPTKQQTVIRAHYLQDKPFNDIAAMMNLTRARVSQIHRQALRRLRELLPQDTRCDVSF